MPELRDYQQEDIIKLSARPSMGVFNEQRTGKTPTSIMAMKAKGVQRLLIVCPASLVYAWSAEYNRWTGGTARVITSGTALKKELYSYRPRQRMQEECIIINYENFRDNSKTTGVGYTLLKKYEADGLIVDEAHRCKSRDSKNFISLRRCKHIPNRLYLSATPAPNVPWDIWAILHMIDPDNYASFWRFIGDYFTTEQNYFGGENSSTPVDYAVGAKPRLAAKLEELSIMRKRKDVMPWLPKEERPTVIKLPCTKSQRKYITELEDTFETEHVITQSILERLIRVRQICAAPAILKLRGSSPKMEWLEQYISDYPEKRLIVFSNSRKFIELVSGVVPFGVITGLTAKPERQRLIDQFQAGNLQGLLIQTQAGKEGLTLDRADVTIFLDTYPPAADYLQAKDRMIATSPDRVKPQEIIHLMMDDTYDEQLYALVDHNVKQTDVLNNYINYIKERRNTNG